mmetsp:Transcript_27671/g.54301  ORF Transcript_27671/g.54301 Transcript_27671/m.54301 type:complete len:256 (-) Transcript_27671:51-818(-)
MWIEENPEAVPLAVKRHKDPFHDKLIFVLLLALGPPAILLTWLSFQPAVILWIGRAGRAVSFFALLLAVVGHDLLARGILRRRFAIIVLLVLPAATLGIAAHVHKVRAIDVRSKLEPHDCSTFPGKVRLEKAWEEANVLFDNCIAHQANLTSAPIDELYQVTRLRNCVGYKLGMVKWGVEWNYLEYLETSQRCAGWCVLRRPLWGPFLSFQPHDRCCLAAAQMMTTMVQRTALQAATYCMAILVLVGTVFSFVEL